MSSCLSILLAITWMDAAQPPIDWAHVRSMVQVAEKDVSRPLP